jgi:N-acetyl sugar amidotransferase
MDTTDPDISFDDDGICSHCHAYDTLIQSDSYRKKREPGALDRLLADIKRKGKGKPYDCIIGVSGGIDSTYTAYIIRKLGLRPLAVHLDNGWDSELAVSNIQKALSTLNIDLYTHVLDWEEFRDLQLAFLKASTPDSEIPTDHAILAILYEVAAKKNVQFILSGHNTATESAGVAAWAQGHGDWRYIKSIHKIHGSRPLKSFPHYGPLKFMYYTLVKGIKFIQILDYLEYDKKQVFTILQEQMGWKYYGGKHYESIYTRFYRGYFLPNKFGFDKRREDLTSLICSGQMSRQTALEEVAQNHYPLALQQQDREYVVKKLGITDEEFEEILTQPVRSFWDYPSYKKLFRNKALLALYHSLKRY